MEFQHTHSQQTKNLAYSLKCSQLLDLWMYLMIYSVRQPMNKSIPWINTCVYSNLWCPESVSGRGRRRSVSERGVHEWVTSYRMSGSPPGTSLLSRHIQSSPEDPVSGHCLHHCTCPSIHLHCVWIWPGGEWTTQHHACCGTGESANYQQWSLQYCVSK